MLKRYLALVSLLILSCGANASMIERDWLADGDKCLTFVSELNIEILDVSFTTNISHILAANELSDGGLYSGFRFMNGNELGTIIDTYFGGMGSQFKPLSNGSSESAQVSSFLELINATITPYGRTLEFNTCEHALGCELGILVGGQYHIRDSERWSITSDYLLIVDQLESFTQLLIRDAVVAVVPEPSGILLLAVGLLLVAGARYRTIK